MWEREKLSQRTTDETPTKKNYVEPVFFKKKMKTESSRHVAVVWKKNRFQQKTETKISI